ARRCNELLPDELVEASAELLLEAWRDMKSSPAWVTAVPSLRRPQLVPDFARRLAARLGLPYHDVLRKIEERPEQREMRNSFQQARNLIGAFDVVGTIPAQTVLLVDDSVD